MLKGLIERDKILFHVLFWILYLIFEITNRGWGHRDYIDFRYANELWFEMPIKIALVYFNLCVLVPYFFDKKKYWTYGFSLIIAMVIGGLYIRFVSYKIWIPQWESLGILEYGPEPKQFFLPIRIIRNSFDFYPLIALTMLLYTLKELYENERQKRELEQQKFKSELAILKAQFHPHFFFNVLNTLYALTIKKSEQSLAMIIQLSGLMHYVLYEANADLILLEKDVEHLRNFIELEKIRFTDRLELSFQYSGNMAGKMIPPLILLPFIENSFKHSLKNESGKAWVTIDIKVVGNTLFFRSENSVPQHFVAPVSGGGVGLKNVIRRLELTHQHRFELNVHEHASVFTAELKIKLND